MRLLFTEENIREIINMKEKLIKMDNNNNNIVIKETEERNEKKKRILKKKKKKKKTKKKKNNNLKNSFSKLKLSNKDHNFVNHSKYKIVKNNTQTHNNNIFYDYELNGFSYKKAKQYDKRNFVSYYMSLIKAKHILIFTFFPKKDYNSIIIKIDLLFISFSIYYFINSLFFDESTIHQIYEDGGIYNFIYLIPYISYSFIISYILSTIIKYIFLSERNIYQIKKEKKLEIAYNKTEKVKKRLIIKYICFFCLSPLIIGFFWYKLSSFGAVYQNTQYYIIINTLISFGLELLYPFIINLIPTFLRISSLKSNNECIYKISKIIQLL